MEKEDKTKKNYLDLLEEEFLLSPKEKIGVIKFNFGDDESMQKNWLSIANTTRLLLMNDFEAGEVELHEMLEAMRKLSLGLPSTVRLFYLGSLAEFGLKTSQKKIPRTKKRGASYAPWFKRIAVDLFDMVKSNHPKVKYFCGEGKDSIYKLTDDFLAGLGFHLPSPKLVEKWLSEPKNKDVQEFRRTKIHRTPTKT